MSDNKEIKIEFRLDKVVETGFLMNLEALETKDVLPDAIKVEFGFKIDIQENDDVLVLHLLAKYSYPREGIDTKILEITSANHFSVKNLADLIEVKEGSFTDKAGLLPPLLGICIGTIRGMMVVKTMGTVLADFPLPIVNPTDILKGSNSRK